MLAVLSLVNPLSFLGTPASAPSRNVTFDIPSLSPLTHYRAVKLPYFGLLSSANAYISTAVPRGAQIVLGGYRRSTRPAIGNNLKEAFGK